MEIKTSPKIHAYAYHICRAWYNGSYTMATKPIKFLELHYTMTQFLIIRIMTFAKYKEKSRPLFLSLKILSIYELNKYLMALFMYSYFTKNLPSYFNLYFKLNDMIHSHNTRTASNIYIDYKRTDYWKCSLKFRGLKSGTNYLRT